MHKLLIFSITFLWWAKFCEPKTTDASSFCGCTARVAYYFPLWTSGNEKQMKRQENFFANKRKTLSFLFAKAKSFQQREYHQGMGGSKAPEKLESIRTRNIAK